MGLNEIYIEEKEKELLFEEMLTIEETEYKYFLRAENLERYCKGKTYLPDYAYSKIRKQLLKEFKIWLLDKEA